MAKAHACIVWQLLAEVRWGRSLAGVRGAPVRDPENAVELMLRLGAGTLGPVTESVWGLCLSHQPLLHQRPVGG